MLFRFCPFAVFLLACVASAASPATSLAQSDPLNARVTLSDGQRSILRTRRDLGFTVAEKKPIRFSVDAAACKRALSRVAKTFNRAAVDAKPVVARGRVVIKSGSAARVLDVAATAGRIAQAAAKNPQARRFVVVLDKKPAILSAEKLKGVNGVLSDFTTRTSDNAKRNRNIRVAIGRIDGTLLSPGESFSLNKYVGKRTQANNFRTAIVFDNGEKVPGIGGGVSQVSGTLFNAAALAGLQIDAARPHSRPVAYLPVGRDTTASDDGIDLKFTNNTKSPVYLSYTFTNGSRLRATVFGRRVPGRKIALRTQTQRLGVGKIDVQTFRVVRTNGKVTGKTRLFTHQYRWKPEPKKGA